VIKYNAIAVVKKYLYANFLILSGGLLMEGYFDGASRGNPGDAGAGCLLIDGGEVIWEKAVYLGKKTNNEAEYNALINLMKEIKRRGIKKARIYGDSKLVISQISRKWKINLPHLRELAREAWSLAESIDIVYEWVPREKNKRADELSNEGIDSGICK
jgi:ribonuclease HI